MRVIQRYLNYLPVVSRKIDTEPEAWLRERRVDRTRAPDCRGINYSYKREGESGKSEKHREGGREAASTLDGRHGGDIVDEPCKAS